MQEPFSWIDWSELQQVGLIALAGALGGLIGIERQIADKPAGIRTHMLVCAASALLMVLGDAVVDAFHQDRATQSISADPVRIIQAIVVGISFLGAGTIVYHGKAQVEGLTTAASILLTAGLGIAVGARQFTLAVGVTILALVVLAAVGYLERLVSRRMGDKRYLSPEESPHGEERDDHARDDATRRVGNAGS